MSGAESSGKPRFPSQHYRRNGNNAPPCWSCQHYQRQEHDVDAYQWCELARQGFPDAGTQCRAYLYEPGADAKEFVQ